MSHLDVPPTPLLAFESGEDPAYGHGTAIYSTDHGIRYQVTRRFDGGHLHHDPGGTLLALGLHPDSNPDGADPDGADAVRLDAWLRPIADAARDTGYAQLIAVCMYGGFVNGRRGLQHWAHGPLNGYFAAGDYLSQQGHTIAIDPRAGDQPCRTCLRERGDLLTELADAGLTLVTVTPGQGQASGARWAPYHPTRRPRLVTA